MSARSSRACPTGCASRSCCTTTPASRSGTWRRCWGGRRAPSRPTCTTRGPGSARLWGKPMDEPRDDVDTWLHERVTPLQPHPGTFEQIRRRARRRKTGRAALAVAGAAVVVAGGIAVPRLILSGHIGGLPSALSGSTATVRQNSPGTAPSTAGSSGPDAASATPTPTQPAVPPNFAPTSVTFVSTLIGWVIGQAGTPGQCGPPNAYICTSIAAAGDGGASWHGVPAPVAGPPRGGTGVSQIRSLDGTSAWAFGPQLYATHNGGQ